MVAQSLGSLLRMVDVLLHDGGACHQDLTLLAVGHFNVCPRLHDLEVHIRERQANAALLGHVDGGQAGGGDRLGGAVAFPYLHHGSVVIQELVHLLL